MSDLKNRIVFMGSPKYAEIILKALFEWFNVVGVITQPDKRVGRGKSFQPPSVKVYSNLMGIPCVQPQNLLQDDAIGSISKWEPDLIVVAAYGKILKKDILDYPKYKCINVHASLLPKWRGASPIQSAILNGDHTTGITIMKIDEGIDTGEILTQREVLINVNDTTASLSENLAFIGGELLVETIPDYFSGTISLQQQNHSIASYTKKINKTDGDLDFQKKAEDLERQVRAYYPWPVSFFQWSEKNIRVYKAKVLKTRTLSVGEKGVIEKYPCIGTRDFDLQLLDIQVPGKQIIDGRAFLNGAKSWLD